MHTAEKVRNEAKALDYEAKEMLLAYADLLEAMEDMLAEEPIEMALVVNEIKRRAAEKVRKG